MDANKLLKAIFAEILQEMKTNQRLKKNIVHLIENHKANSKKKHKPANRRRPGLLDPMEVYRRRPEKLHPELDVLDIEQLKDIIAEHGMDKDRLAMKWKTKSRLIERIISTVEARSHKGDAFR